MPTNSINSPTYNLMQGIDPNTVFQGQGEAGAADPFQLGSYYDKSGSAPQNEFQSPGYQAYGQDWVNLLNAISQQDQAASTAYANAAGLATADRNDAGKGGPQDILQDFSNQYPLNKNSNLYKQVNEGNFSDPANNQALMDQIKPQVAQALGLDPNSPEADTYTQAFFTYANQNSGRDNAEQSSIKANREGSFENVLGDIGAFGASVLAGGGAEGLVGGGLEGLLHGATDFGSGDDFSLFKAVQGATQGLPGLTTGNPISSLTSALSSGSGVGGDTGDILKAAGAGVGLGNNASSGDLFGTIGGALNIGQQAGSVFGDNPESGTSGNDISGTGSVDNISGGGFNPSGNSQNNISGNGGLLDISGTGGAFNPSGNFGEDNMGGLTGGISNVPGTPAPSNLTQGLNAASGANNISGLLQGIIGNGQQPDTSSFGTNIISTPVTASEAAGIPQAGNWTDKQYQDYQTEIMAKVSSGQMTQVQAQQALQQAQQLLVGE